MVLFDSVLVARDNIDVGITRVPVIVVELRGPNVDEIVHSTLHQIALGIEVELLERLGTVVAPPEPSLSAPIAIAGSFVEGAPEYGDALSLVVKKIAADGVEILVEDALLGRTGFQGATRREEGGGATAFGARGVVESEAVLRREVGADGHTPVPDEAHYTAGIVPRFGRRAHIIDIALAEMLEIEDVDGRVTPSTLIESIGISGVIVPARLAA